MWEALFKNLDKYVSLTAEEQEVVRSLFREKRYRKHQFIVQQGDVVRHETFIASGLTKTYETDEKGQEHILQFGVRDWWVGDLYSFLTRTPSELNIDCLEDTVVYQITYDNHEILYNKVPKLERHFRIMIQNAYISSMNRISSALSKSAKERYEEFIEKYPQINQRVSNQHIASYLGITPQSLSRIRNKRT